MGELDVRPGAPPSFAPRAPDSASDRGHGRAGAAPERAALRRDPRPRDGGGAEALDRVEASQELVAIDPLLAEVAVERADAAVTRTRSQLALARSHLERLRSLAERGVASPSDLDDALNGEKVAAAVLRESRAERVRARDELSKKKIAAPFAGVLRSCPVEVGEYMHEGQQLAELLDLETVRVTIGLSDREVVAVRAGHRVDVQVEAYAQERFGGRSCGWERRLTPYTRSCPSRSSSPTQRGDCFRAWWYGSRSSWASLSRAS